MKLLCPACVVYVWHANNPRGHDLLQQCYWVQGMQADDWFWQRPAIAIAHAKTAIFVLALVQEAAAEQVPGGVREGSGSHGGC